MYRKFELKTIVKNMTKKKNSTDGVNTKLLKLSFESIGDQFLQVINNSLQKGEFSNTWKITIVIPIEKNQNTILCQEHRRNMVPSYDKLQELVVVF
ncbi:hypothetical protein NQ314_001174 [Rhamnusium bicolor]|uniref:Uncharacterized protein n=1 Tax=Rhamnusium bicolor TaxID=1586634 RepID=A0AAV8ZUY4_9CUCU|nr:hypothetical protein NQ314_001174 [Rhamnusium bicolor]